MCVLRRSFYLATAAAAAFSIASPLCSNGIIIIVTGSYLKRNRQQDGLVFDSIKNETKTNQNNTQTWTRLCAARVI